MHLCHDTPGNDKGPKKNLYEEREDKKEESNKKPRPCFHMFLVWILPYLNIIILAEPQSLNITYNGYYNKSYVV